MGGVGDMMGEKCSFVFCFLALYNCYMFHLRLRLRFSASALRVP